jgi:nucleoside triphosphate diphosphatase
LLPRDRSDALVHDQAAGLDRLAEIMRRLRDRETGCPWDIEQNFDSIVPYTLEEAHEVADAITRRAWGELPGELGDLLLQVVYHAQMAEEAGYFGLEAVIAAICDKMISRHPHVFGDASRDKSASQQTQDWEAAKAAERKGRVLDGVAMNLPALTRAVKLQNRAARVGFDWPHVSHVVDKIVEEARELAEAGATADPAAIADEFGDMMFVMANLARHMGVDPEAALRAANSKFTRRFNYIEESLDRTGTRFDQAGLEGMDAIWNEAKTRERDGSL